MIRYNMCHSQIHSNMSCLKVSQIIEFTFFLRPALNLHLPIVTVINYPEMSVSGRVSSIIIERRTKYIGNSVAAVKDESILCVIQLVCYIYLYNPLSPRAFAYTLLICLLQRGLITVINHIFFST